MSANVIVFDIETKYSFDAVGGRNHLDKLGISLLGAYDYMNGKYSTYMEEDIVKFIERLSKRPLLVGFNSKKFDIVVLQPYAKDFNLSELPHLDIMEELQKALGHRLSLESVATATLGAGKSGSGLDALRFYENGEWDKLKKYCLDDVKLTKEIYEYGAKHGELLYHPKFGTGKARAPVSWPPPEGTKPPSQYDLF